MTAQAHDQGAGERTELIHPERDWRRFLGEGRFMLPRARRSGACFFPPRVAEPLTGDNDLEWVEASGDGTVYSTSVIRHRSPHDDYNIALIDLAEGPRLMSRVEEVPPDQVTIGMKVKARIIVESGEPMLVFVPREER